MCGLVGMAGFIDTKMRKVMKDLLVLDTVRGPHSTGVTFVDHTGELETIKAVGNAWDLFDSNKFSSRLVKQTNLLLGHNRYATKGAINKVNAHPFDFNGVTGAHNGTLTTQVGLDDYRDFVVDSENLYHHMNNNGVDDTIKKLQGAYALTWYEHEDGSINFCRNDQRPLVYCYTEDRKTLMWASEGWMLEVAALRNGVKITDLVSTAIHKVYKFVIPTGWPNAQSKEFTDISVRPVQPYKAPLVVVNRTKPAGNAGKKFLTYQDLTPFVGSTLEFEVTGAEQFTAYGVGPHIKGRLVGDEHIPVKIFVDKTSKEWDDLLSSKNTFFGEAHRCTLAQGGYLTIKPSSIIELEFPDLEDDVANDDEPPFQLTGPQGQQITLGQFNALTKAGCGWCGDVVTVKDAGEMVWVEDGFVCPGCKNVEEVKTYLMGGV